MPEPEFDVSIRGVCSEPLRLWLKRHDLARKLPGWASDLLFGWDDLFVSERTAILLSYLPSKYAFVGFWVHGMCCPVVNGYVPSEADYEKWCALQNAPAGWVRRAVRLIWRNRATGLQLRDEALPPGNYGLRPSNRFHYGKGE